MKKVLYILLLSLISLGVYAQKGMSSVDPVDIVIYPNPCADYLQVKSNSEEISTIKIVDVVGTEMVSFLFASDKKYSVHALRSGIYLVQIFDQNNKLIATRRLKKS